MAISVRHCAKRVKSAERTKLTKRIKRTKRKQGEDNEYHCAMTAIASSPATGRIVGEPVIRDNPFVGAGNVHDVVMTGGIQLARRVLFKQHAHISSSANNAKIQRRLFSYRE